MANLDGNSLRVIVTDEAREDIGEVPFISLDVAFGSDENNFKLSAYADDFKTGKGALVYVDGTEYGGIIDDISVSLDAGDDRIMTYKGRTFTGILANLVVQPSSGQDYYTVSGDANAVLGQVITHLGAGDIFSASGAASGLTVSFTFPRYCDAYTGLRKLADSCGGILHHAYDHSAKRVVLSVEARPTLPEISNEEATITLASRRPYNHVIVGGAGELKDRVIVHRYADGAGNISTTQTFTGADEMAYFYDLNTAEQADAEEAADIWLAEAQGSDTTTVEVTSEELEFDVGDHVTVSDPETGTAAEVVIGKKIVRIDPYDGYTACYVTANNAGAISAVIDEDGAGLNPALAAYPVGAIYMSANPTSPAALFGGTWQRITGRFLLAATDEGSSGASQAAGNTGGEATHTLTTDEMPSHTHVQNQHRHALGRRNVYTASGSAVAVVNYNAGTANDNYTGYTTATNQNTGGGQAHNNMPPYLAVYVWQRTA